MGWVRLAQLYPESHDFALNRFTRKVTTFGLHGQLSYYQAVQYIAGRAEQVD